MSPKGNPSIAGAGLAGAVLLKLLVFAIVPSAADCAQQPLETKLAPLLKTSCLACHGAGTKTPLDLSRLGYNLSDPVTFHTWERVFTRVENGEMPPKGVARPNPAVAAKALGGLKLALIDANLKARGGQRTPLRRLTRLEYGYTVQDLLLLDEAQGVELAELLPAEADSGGFDTVAAHQGISPIHVKSYLNAADRALDMALALGPRPETRTFNIDYPQSKSVVYFRNPKVNGGGFNMKLDDGEAIFFDFLSSYITHSQMNGFRVAYPGRYRVTVEAYAYRPARPNKPLALTLYKGIVPPGATAVLSELLGSVDLDGNTPKTLQATTYLRPGEAVAPNVANFANQYAALAFVGPGKSIKDYQGEGMALRTMTIEGPLLAEWPPECARQLLKGIEFDESGQIRLTKAPYAHVLEIVTAFATRAFRRPLAAGEAEQYASLAKPQLAAGHPFLEALREPLRAILAAPAFLYQAGPPGALDAYSLASRLSYFLWRGPPDTELLDVARNGRLRDPAVLARQVERMLGDAKSERFVNDFAAQAFRLRDLRRTTPDRGLYPDYDDRLGQAMRRETEMFLGELIARDMGVRNLIDSDFTFVNRRLAEHYGIAGITGTEMRKVTLPPESHRGGLLTQASILKLTSNGTTTSPVPRGNFVLTCLLGQPTPPPPPGVGTIEPDTRGATTIREQLTAHRNSAVCGSCHRRIDPPGFALESFDPIGGFRTCYRKSGGTTTYGKYPVALPYGQGPAVDPSGVTPEGDAFQGIDEYKRLMLEKNLDQVARHFVSGLLIYSTGAEIEFADRDAVEQILKKTRDRGYPVRTIIHEVVASDLFRRR